MGPLPASISAIRSLAPATGQLNTAAGTGATAPGSNGGQAAQAGLFQPCGLVADADGNLVVADTQNRIVRVIAHASGQFYGKSMKAGHIYTVAGDGTGSWRRAPARSTARP